MTHSTNVFFRHEQKLQDYLSTLKRKQNLRERVVILTLVDTPGMLKVKAYGETETGCGTVSAHLQKKM